MPDPHRPNRWEPPEVPRRRRHLALAASLCLLVAVTLGFAERWLDQTLVDVARAALYLAAMVLLGLVVRGNRRQFGRWMP